MFFLKAVLYFIVFAIVAVVLGSLLMAFPILNFILPVLAVLWYAYATRGSSCSSSDDDF